MKKIKIIYIYILCAVFIISGCVYICFKNNTQKFSCPVSITAPIVFSENSPSYSNDSSYSSCLIDAKSKAVLYSKNQNERLPMASTTKIMTCLVILDNLPLDRIITIDKRCVGIEGSSMYLFENEKISVENLLYGLMLSSGNDAATALALACSDSIEEFAKLMNDKAKQIGLIDTNFTNPHGLDDENHYTTSFELALITAKALENETFKKIVSTKTHYMTTSSGTVRYFSNHNRLLSSFDGAIGVKTGFTKRSGRCLVSAAQINDETYVAVTIKDPNDWINHKNMLNFAFNNFDTIEIAKQGAFTVHLGSNVFSNPDSIYLTVPQGVSPIISYKANIKPTSGKVDYFADGVKIGFFGLDKLADNSVMLK